MNGEQALVSIASDIKTLRDDITAVMTNGCAKREGDLNRIIHVEDGIKELNKTMKSIFYTTLMTAGGIIVFLLKAFLPYIFK